MRFAWTIALVPVSAFGTTLTVLKTTPQQIILRIVADNLNGCTVQASTSVSYSPVVHDVDATLFTGANLCTRSSSIVNGSTVIFVLGQVGAAWDSAGTWVRSRSLQAATKLYIRAIDGNGNIATASAVTKTIPMGQSLLDPLPADPTNNGGYLLPHFISPTDQTESVIDPNTGVLLRRATLPQQQFSNQTGSQAFGIAFSTDAGWTGTCPSGSTSASACPALNKTYDGSHAVTYTGAGSGTPGYLFVAPVNFLSSRDTWSGGTASFDWFQTVISAKINNGSCVGDNCKAQVCLTVDGATCWSPLKDITLTTSMTQFTLGDQTANMSFWKPAYSDNLPHPEISTSTTTASVGGDGVTVTWVSGDRWRVKWVSNAWLHFSDGSHTADCQASGVSLANGNVITLASNTCLSGAGFTIPTVSNVTVTSESFGVLIKKKTNVADTVSIGGTYYTYGSSIMENWWTAGAFSACGQQDGNGAYCTNPTGGVSSALFWVANTGASSFIGQLTVPGKAVGNAWAKGSLNIANWMQDSTGAFYGLIKDSAGKWVILKALITDPAHTPSPNVNNSFAVALGSSCTDTTYSLACSLNGVSNAITWTVLTPTSLSQDLGSMLVNFTASESLVYDPTQMPNCYLRAMIDGELMGFCEAATTQDVAGWLWRLNVGDGNPAHAGSTGPHIDAATPSWAGNYPMRYCAIHGIASPGDTGGWERYTPSDIQTGANTIAGQGPWVAQINLTSVPAGSIGDTLDITLSAEPTQTNGLSGQLKTVTSAVGDTFLVSTSPTSFAWLTNEVWQVTAKNGLNLTVKRRAQVQAIAGPATIYVVGLCGGYAVGYTNTPNVQGIWWNMNADPHALNAGYSVSTDPDAYGAANTLRKSPSSSPDHSAIRNNIMDIVSANGYCAAGLSTCYQVFNPTLFGIFGTTIPNPNGLAIANAPAFAGAPSGNINANVYQSHASYVADNPPANSVLTAQDDLVYGGGNMTGTLSPVAGTGRLWKMGTTVGATPDDLSGNAVLSRKRWPTHAVAGRFALFDASGPNSASTFDDSASNAYRYCVVRIAGECHAGSAAGEIYVNFPYIGYSTFNGSSAACTGSATSMFEGTNYRSIPCFSNSAAGANGIFEFDISQNDTVGVHNRTLTQALSRNMLNNVFNNSRYFPDKSWFLAYSQWVGGYRHEILLGQEPPFGGQSSIDRTTFVPVAVNLQGPAGTSTADVVFGYAEYGTPTQGYCTSRKEACVANAGTVNQAVPFQFLTTDTFAHLACSSGCVISIPLLPGHVAYWYPRFFNGGGAQIGGGTTYLQVAYEP